MDPVLVASRCLLSLQQPKRCAKLHVLPYGCHLFFCVNFSAVLNNRPRRFDSPSCHVRKDPAFTPWAPSSLSVVVRPPCGLLLWSRVWRPNDFGRCPSRGSGAWTFSKLVRRNMCVLLSNIKLRVSLFGKNRAVYSLNSEIVSRFLHIHHVRPCHPPACFHLLSCSLPPLISYSSACTRPCALFILTRITSYSGCLLRICPSFW